MANHKWRQQSEFELGLVDVEHMAYQKGVTNEMIYAAIREVMEDEEENEEYKAGFSEGGLEIIQGSGKE